MHRRNFIRLMGGGAVVSSLASLSACNDAFPAEAVAAWQGPGNAPDVRRWEVQAGRAYLRLQFKATELGLQIHPMSQAPQEFAEMKPWYDRLHMLLLGWPASQETVQMFCRVGYCAPQQHTPRSALQGFLKA